MNSLILTVVEKDDISHKEQVRANRNYSRAAATNRPTVRIKIGVTSRGYYCLLRSRRMDDFDSGTVFPAARPGVGRNEDIFWGGARSTARLEETTTFVPDVPDEQQEREEESRATNRRRRSNLIVS